MVIIVYESIRRRMFLHLSYAYQGQLTWYRYELLIFFDFLCWGSCLNDCVSSTEEKKKKKKAHPPPPPFCYQTIFWKLVINSILLNNILKRHSVHIYEEQTMMWTNWSFPRPRNVFLTQRSARHCSPQHLPLPIFKKSPSEYCVEFCGVPSRDNTRRFRVLFDRQSNRYQRVTPGTEVIETKNQKETWLMWKLVIIKVILFYFTLLVKFVLKKG